MQDVVTRHRLSHGTTSKVYPVHVGGARYASSHRGGKGWAVLGATSVDVMVDGSVGTGTDLKPADVFNSMPTFVVLVKTLRHGLHVVAA